MNHKAIYKLYPNVVTVDDSAGAFDKDGNKIEIDLAAVNAWQDPEQYKYDRAAEYPSIVDQLDLLYHGGMDAWKSAIQAVKDRYPKP
jgi:hypothetical protein